MQRWLDIATLIQPKRTDGGLVVEAATGLPFLLSAGMRVHLVPPQTDLPRVVDVLSIADARERSAVVRFDGIDTLDQAQALCGCHCIIERTAVEDLLADVVPAFGAFDGFVGWRVCDQVLGDVGQVVACEEHPQQLTLTVRTPQGEDKLVPLVEDLLTDADEEAQVLHMHLPAGILEL